jgi:hypothetical protein
MSAVEVATPPDSTPELAARVQRLEDFEAIRALFLAYGRLADAGRVLGPLRRGRDGPQVLSRSLARARADKGSCKKGDGRLPPGLPHREPRRPLQEASAKIWLYDWL